jgi:3-hydroxyacyl-[acyl-carrier-protein] dehydratase
MNDKLPYPFLLERSAIESLIPHRGEFLFARRLHVIAADRYLGEASWEPDQAGIAGHFPGCTVVPAVFIIEAAAQLAGAGLLAASAIEQEDTGDSLGMLAGTRRCLFQRPVRPRETVTYELTARRISGDFMQVRSEAASGEEPVASLEFLIARVPLEKIAPLLPIEALRTRGRVPLPNLQTSMVTP